MEDNHFYDGVTPPQPTSYQSTSTGQPYVRQGQPYQPTGPNLTPPPSPAPTVAPSSAQNMGTPMRNEPYKSVPPQARELRPQNPQPPKPKKSNFFVKALGAVALALIFGVVSGVTIWGAFLIGNKLDLYTISTGSEVITSEPVSDTPEKREPTSVTSEITTGVSELPSETIGTEAKDVSEVAAAVMPSMVSILTTIDYKYYGYTEEAEGSGSGFIVGENETELLIATNYHVIEGGKSIQVQFADMSTAEAVVKGKNIPMDVAVIAVKIDLLEEGTKAQISFAELGDSNTLKVGEPAIAIGNALGYGQSVTTGVISALNREQTLSDGSTGYFIQTDAAINPGNSGGALLNMKGQVIGINSSKLGGTIIEGMGYAIPISVAQPIITELASKKTLIEVAPEEKSYLGISGATVSSTNTAGAPAGIYISEVTPGSPADLGGMLRGDIITEFEGDSLANIEDLKMYLASYPAGTTVTITVMRDLGDGSYHEVELTVTLEHEE